MSWAVLQPIRLWRLVRASVTAWSDDYAPSMGAALAYYTVFSMAPLLLIIIGIAGLVLGREAAQGQIVAQLRDLLGDQGAGAIEGLIRSTGTPMRGGLATLIGVVTLAIGATSVFGELQTDLDRIWHAPAAKRKEGLWGLIRSRILAFGMIGAVAFLLLVSLVASAAIAALSAWWAPWFGHMAWLWHAVNLVAGLLLTTVLFALVYKVLPRVSIAWHDVWVGSFVTALLFSVGRFLIGLYIGKSGVVSGFGAAGSLAVVLVWVYYSAQIFLLGAEFTWVYAYEYGSRRNEKPPGRTREIPSLSDPSVKAGLAAAGPGSAFSRAGRPSDEARSRPPSRHTPSATPR